ncbi:hypothetical protein BL250_02700 [Erwinia sp. OLTSP20]|uniref:hypothetical protein n=1 Tax=unclassified Erwinia TaxID=2622719 RepID=UPI000C199792|nr:MULTISPECIES: hypothetical protein [unclassified Erwinia]PIJ51891.1 hypothetical protein BV501_01600 [Erwinia sp. OAMSP11]PIJ74765.1 hypothetical protein BK416_02935 [Erwinia sp. OLSSP12]PIJ85151.1 hypothetical protein BLD47_00675 [Erwinia sp. OLCASP19]PIJ87152.1 hypothetical protein BLD46_01070 [Erwinia sp. OLMTSP26]PIJ88296.1 hypothetical protein BLD49_02125 [Erwinia sp. OLMDSP33]
MDRNAREDKLLAIIGLLSAALVTVIVIFFAAWIAASHATPLTPGDTVQLCQSVSIVAGNPPAL